MIGFTFNGRHSSDFGLKVKSVEKGILPSLDRKTNSLKYGDYLVTTRVEPREITVNIFMDSLNYYTFEELVMEVASWLYTEEPKKLIFDDNDSVYYMAMLSGDSDIDQIQWKSEVSLKFVCLDPFSYGNNQRSIKDLTTMIANIPYKGTAPSYPIISGTFSDSSIGLGINNRNMTLKGTGNKISFIVDTWKGSVKYNGENALKYMTLDSEFPKLSKGTNIFTRSFTDPITITWFDKFI